MRRQSYYTTNNYNCVIATIWALSSLSDFSFVLFIYYWKIWCKHCATSNCCCTIVVIEAKPKYKKISLKKLMLRNVIFYEYPPLISSKAPVVNFDLNEKIEIISSSYFINFFLFLLLWWYLDDERNEQTSATSIGSPHIPRAVLGA